MPNRETTDNVSIGKEQRRWHIGKEIPVATIVMLVSQTVAFVWWAASISAKVESIDKASVVQGLVQAQIDRRQDDEQLRSEGRLTQQLREISIKVDRVLEQKR